MRTASLHRLACTLIKTKDVYRYDSQWAAYSGSL